MENTVITVVIPATPATNVVLIGKLQEEMYEKTVWCRQSSDMHPFHINTYLWLWQPLRFHEAQLSLLMATRALGFYRDNSWSFLP
ncbi:hypothetical protein Y032_0444g1574 [Ancylostoma ceylanicum]|uniref:Uncharacterized protein n=1 Tax=Ancylostoma ceylanicum TaxID=53326 RepID=A0A016WZE9_9BILA|nr:hypothetical protein Y032_0444g1574 [Ancylostoma ceylanicum]